LTNKPPFPNFAAGMVLLTKVSSMVTRSRDERLQIMLSPDELTALDNFRFKVRMPSRASAVRELLKRGLAAEGFDSAAFGSKSSDFGVIGKGSRSRRPVTSNSQ
jgi:hypothetical protein